MRRSFRAHAFALRLHHIDYTIDEVGGADEVDKVDESAECTDENDRANESGVEESKNESDELDQSNIVGCGWVKTATCGRGCNCQGPGKSLEKEDEYEDECDDDVVGDEYDDDDVRHAHDHYIRTIKHYRAHVARVETLRKGGIRTQRRAPRLGRMKRELEQAMLRGRRTRVEQRVAEAIEKREAVVNYGRIDQDLVTPTFHLDYSGGGAMLNEMRAARIDYDRRAAWAMTSRSLEPLRRVFEDKFNIKGDRIPTVKKYLGDLEDRENEAKRNGVQADEISKEEGPRVYDPAVFMSSSRMDIDWVRKQRMAGDDWIREYVEWAVDTGSTHIVTNDKRLVVDPRPTRMTITGVMSRGDRLQAEGGIEGKATDVDGRKVELKLDQTLLHEKANMNLLGAKQLLQKGNIIHLEEGNCYMIVRTRGGGVRVKYQFRKEEDSLS